MNNTPFILLIEDDKAIVNFMNTVLCANQYRVLHAQTGREALALISSHCPDVILLDLGLPDMDGLEIIRSVRQWTKTPIIVVSARSREQEKVDALDAGADDYVTRPFELEVLHSRILALLRRTQGTEEARMVCDDLTLIPDRQTVLCGREEIPLSGQEYAILCMLMHNKGRTVTRRQLLDEIWDSNGNYVNDNTLTVTMKRLREKLHHPACLKTVRSFGYRMEDTL